jgi:hypothetical protein
MAHIIESIDTVGFTGTDEEIDEVLEAYADNIRALLPEGVTFDVRRGGRDFEAYRELEAHGIDQYTREDAWERAL